MAVSSASATALERLLRSKLTRRQHLLTRRQHLLTRRQHLLTRRQHHLARHQHFAAKGSPFTVLPFCFLGARCQHGLRKST